MNDPFETGIHTGICGFIHMDVVCLLLLFGYVSFHSIASHSVSWQISVVALGHYGTMHES